MVEVRYDKDSWLCGDVGSTPFNQATRLLEL
jgi:hypothetical protein